MAKKPTKNFIENAAAILYYIRRKEKNPLKATAEALTNKLKPQKSNDDKQSKNDSRRILRTFEKMLNDELLTISENESVTNANPNLVEAIKQYSTPKAEKEFIEYIRDEKNITIYPFVSVGNMFEKISALVCGEITRISNSENANDTILVYYGSTLEKFANEVIFTEQAKKDAERILAKRNRNKFSIIRPTIGNIMLPKIPTDMFKTLHEKSSNNLTSKLSDKLYGTCRYDLALVTQPAFICSPDTLSADIIKKMKKEWGDNSNLMREGKDIPKNFLFSLGPTATLEREQQSSFQKIYQLIYPDIFENDYWKKNVKAELLGRVYDINGKPIGKEDPTNEEYIDKPSKELTFEEKLQNLNYLNLGISTKQLNEISTYYYNESKKEISQSLLPMGVCAIVGGSTQEITNKADSVALFIHNSRPDSAPPFNKLFCIDQFLSAVKEKLLNQYNEKDRFEKYKEARIKKHT